jgi:hypothetical protein
MRPKSSLRLSWCVGCGSLLLRNRLIWAIVVPIQRELVYLASLRTPSREAWRIFSSWTPEIALLFKNPWFERAWIFQEVEFFKAAAA